MFDSTIEKTFMDEIAPFAFEKAAAVSEEIYNYNVIDNFSSVNFENDKYFNEVFHSFELLPLEKAVNLKLYLIYLSNSPKFNLSEAAHMKTARNLKVLSGILNGIKGRSYTFVEVNRTLCLKYNSSYGYTKEFDLGRLYPLKHSINQISREYRWYLFDGIYQDVDIVNAHPSMLLNFAKAQLIKTPSLEKLVATRDSFYDDVLKEYKEIGMMNIEIKKLVLAALNSGRVDYKSKTLKSLSLEIQSIKEELYRIKISTKGAFYEAIMSRCKDIEVTDEILKQKTQSLYCFCEETRNLLALRNTLLEKLDEEEVSIIPFFDGFYISYNEFRSLSNTNNAVYLRLSEIVDEYNKTSSDLIQMKIKAMTEEHSTVKKDEFDKIMNCIGLLAKASTTVIKRMMEEGSIKIDISKITSDIILKHKNTDTIVLSVEDIANYKRVYHKSLVDLLNYIYDNMEYVKTFKT